MRKLKANISKRRSRLYSETNNFINCKQYLLMREQYFIIIELLLDFAYLKEKLFKRNSCTHNAIKIYFK